MNNKKLLIIFNILFMLVFSGCSSTDAISKNDSTDIIVKGITLKVSLIQTAYEIYKVNIVQSKPFDENTYKNSSKSNYKHYKWLRDTYNSMDNDMKNRLSTIFLSYDAWDYINAVIDLDDDANLSEIINTLQYDDYLNLPEFLQEDLDKFFVYFYDEFFESYMKKNYNNYDKKAKDLNKKLYKNNVHISSFIQDVSGVKLDRNYKAIIYYNFNPIETHSFEYENYMISTISPSENICDIVSLPFYKYSRPIFSKVKYNEEFLKLSLELENDQNLMDMYEDIYKTNYPFNDWCLENLISGFAKYLDYRYFGSTYEASTYIYDLDFYNYLKKINFNPNKISLEKVSLDFYKEILNK